MLGEVKAREKLDRKELLSLGVEDDEFFCRTFFPRTCPKRLPPFHLDIWYRIQCGHRRVAMEVFRDGAKTSILRQFAAKRIGYGLSRTIMLVGKGQDHAIKSVRWLKKQIRDNALYRDTYRLKPGDKWTDEWIEIESELFKDEYGENLKINVIAYGMTGQIRGVNIDDFRPDLIIVDDPCDEENTATPEQRKKMSDLFFGALYNCLMPARDNPAAMMILLQTGLQEDDLINICKKDPEWHSIEYSVYTADGESQWPDRWTKEDLDKEKAGYIARNQLDLWLREKECQLISPASAYFSGQWLGYYDLQPERMTVVIAIDPVPPPTDIQVAKGLHDRDYEVILAMGIAGKNKYLLEYVANRGHNPDWTIAKFFELALRWKPVRVVVETTNYQATLKWLLEKEMSNRRMFYTVEGFDDKAKKTVLINNAFSGVSINRDLFVRKEHVEFISQWTTYPQSSYDDVINAAALAYKKLTEIGDLSMEEEEVDDLDEDDWRTAP